MRNVSSKMENECFCAFLLNSDVYLFFIIPIKLHQSVLIVREVDKCIAVQVYFFIFVYIVYVCLYLIRVALYYGIM